MSKILYITANPKYVDESFCLTIGQKFITACKEKNPEDEIIELDLYKEHIPLIDKDVLASWGKLAINEDLEEKERTKVNRINELVDQFLQMDQYVIATPLWNLSIPPMMKAYIDCIMMVGKTFKYTEEGPIGLLHDKKAVHIQARGGFYSEGPAKDVEMGDRYIRAILNFMGITNVKSIIMEGHAYDPSKTDEILSRAIDEAIEVAKEFTNEKIVSVSH